MALLSVEDVRVEFGGIVALADLSFTIDEGQICALIGPNGAGKTTLFNCVSRLYQPTSGAIEFDGHDLLRMPAHRIARRRDRAHVPEPRAVPGADRACDNVLVGGVHARPRERASGAPRRTRSSSGSSLDAPRGPARGRPAVRHAEAHRDRARARRAARGCCCSTSRPPGSRTPRSTSSAT